MLRGCLRQTSEGWTCSCRSINPLSLTYKEKRMDIQVIGQLIASLGFPIVACCGLFWFINKQDTRHNDEMSELRKSIENNTTVLTSLKDLIQIVINKESSK